MSSMYLVRIEELDGSRVVVNLLFHDRERARRELRAVARRHDFRPRPGYDDDWILIEDIVRASVERVPVIDGNGGGQ